jgi:glycosyltransferase involved in cell wall biosynthesis
VNVLIFHGYLLRGTGSNIYNLSLCRALAALGHEVNILCQERRWRELDLPPGVTVHNPDIGRILPVYVPDEYEGFEAVPLTELGDAEVESYVAANVEAVAEVVDAVAPDVALANHLVMGPAILARAVGGRVPYAVKIHGSALEYTVRPQPERFLPWAREGLAQAGGVLVGSTHTAEALWGLVGEDGLRERTRLGPPGVDVHEFRPRPPAEAAQRLGELAAALEDRPAADWGGERGAAQALRELGEAGEPVVSYVGKLIVSKGVDLLLAAWPLVVREVPEARLCVVGFGVYREGLGAMLDALGAGDLDAVRELAARGREAEGGPAGELTYLAAFLDSLEGERRADYARAARVAAGRVAFTGRLEHEDLPALLAVSEAQVVPSTFPEAFGMVAAEAAACGALPLSASHSGLAEVTATLAGALEPGLRDLLSFRRGPGAVEEIADRLVRWLTLPEPERAGAAGALADLARSTYGWESVAERVVAAARGELSGLPKPGVPATPSGPPSG